jgi:hypothetical protein
MALSRIARLLTLLLVLYVSADLMDPAIPGAFSFDNQSLFLDGVAQAKMSSPNITAMDRILIRGLPDGNDESAIVSVRASARATPPPQIRWNKLKHDDSTSYGSSAPPDSPPTPPQS